MKERKRMVVQRMTRFKMWSEIKTVEVEKPEEKEIRLGHCHRMTSVHFSSLQISCVCCFYWLSLGQFE